MKYSSYYPFFRNFANKTKFDIISALRAGPLSVTDIAKAISMEQSKVSHNLRKLNHCHILNVKQKGRQRIYSLNNETVAPMLKIVEQHVKKYCGRVCKR